MYKYLHEKAARTVYRLPREPQVSEQKKRGKLVGWHITMEYSITRADNQLEGGRWKFATLACPDQHLDLRYTPEQALFYFRMRYEPQGEEIGIEEYERLHAEYEAEAKSRRPNA